MAMRAMRTSLMPSRAISLTAASRMRVRALARAAARLGSTTGRTLRQPGPEGPCPSEPGDRWLGRDGAVGDLDVLVGHAVGHLDAGDVARAVVAEVREALALLVVERLRGQRLEPADLLEC